MDENENSSKHNGLFKGVLYGSITGVALSLITGSPGVIPLAITAGILAGALYDRFFRNEKK
ncbi:hypothetical protein C7120_04590 [Prevotella sp. oral taxon 376]|uniref:hypothetical protein n=1 Tax=Prevotella sp. oral taxon 376 TaxID=712466 RepID=UPI000D1EC018|nr:hypothetical protein [Prevotella sp. oral taxon 376]PTL33872.1 hypothetical protein C7120_04590 [Prevotella sp. oral taxon 376]